MRALVFIALLFGSVALATPHKQRVYTFTQAQFDKMQDELGELVRRREAEAFEDGQQYVRERCPSLI